MLGAADEDDLVPTCTRWSARFGASTVVAITLIRPSLLPPPLVVAVALQQPVDAEDEGDDDDSPIPGA